MINIKDIKDIVSIIKEKENEPKEEANLKENEYKDNTSKSSNNQINKNLSLIRNILELPRQNRTKENLEYLLENFKDINFFRLGIVNYGKEIIYNILECCGLLELNENSVILNSKENATSAYILISGEILISTKEAIFEQRKKSKDLKKKLSSIVYKYLHRKSTNFFLVNNENEKEKVNDEENEEDSKKIKNCEKLIIENWHVKIGEMFGDKSLIERKIR
jgi:hypothetical protein